MSDSTTAAAAAASAPKKPVMGPQPPPLASARDLDDPVDFEMPLLPDGTRATGTSLSQGKTKEDLLREFDNTPLFMRELPPEEEDGEARENATLDALQSLAFDGTPDEVAENFKGQGNEYFKAKRYRDAATFYDKALDAHPTEPKLLENLHLNRAACNLELKNYGKVLRDTSAALKLNPNASKAFYRAARALLALRRARDALDCCTRAGADVVAADPGFKALTERARREAENEEKREREAKERERRKVEEERALNVAFLARGLWIEKNTRPPDNPFPAHFDPDALAPESRPDLPLLNSTWRAPDPIRTPLVLPVFLLYPQHDQSDLITHFHEDETIGDRLDAVFPSDAPPQPWDAERREYVSKRLVVYASTRRRRLFKVGRGLTLRELMDKGAESPSSTATDSAPTAEEQRKARAERDGLILRDGILSLIVLPRESEAEREWVAKFKREREAAEAEEKRGKTVVSSTRVG
ncbi:HSP70/90 co-chaperone [Tilletia horrida]|nr:HSP70/90 co-chaperone [Tilletia horrida]